MVGVFSQYKGFKKEIYVLFIGKVVTSMGAFVWPMLTFFLTEKLGFSDSLAAVLIASATILSLPVAMLGGKLADSFSRKKIIIIFDCSTVFLYVLSAILPLGIHTAVMVFLAGLFQTAESPAYDALQADFSSVDDRERAFSFSYLGYNVGFIFGASMSGILFEKYLSLSFLLNGVAIFISTLLIMLFVSMNNVVGAENSEETFGEYEQPVDENRSVWSVLKERKVVLYMLIVGCIGEMSSGTLGILLPLQVKNMRSGEAIYGYVNSLNGLVVILFTPILTAMLKKFTEIPKSTAGILLFAAGMCLYSIGNIVWLLFFAMFIYTLGEVITVIGSNPYASRRIPASHRGRVGGISSVAYALFSAGTQYLIAYMLKATGNNYRLIWLVFVGVGVLVAGMYLTLYRMDKRTFPNLYKRGKKE